MSTAMKHLTLRLYHGRSSAAVSLDEWGVDGPYIPIDSAVWTYGNLRVTVADDLFEVMVEAGCDVLGGSLSIPMDLDCLQLGGVSYGDWSIQVEDRGSALRTISDTPTKLRNAFETAREDVKTLNVRRADR